MFIADPENEISQPSRATSDVQIRRPSVRSAAVGAEVIGSARLTQPVHSVTQGLY